MRHAAESGIDDFFGWWESLPAGTLEWRELLELADGPIGDRRVETVIAAGFAMVCETLSGSEDDSDEAAIDRMATMMDGLLSVNKPNIMTEEELEKRADNKVRMKAKLQQAKAMGWR
jgi:hypothetical protein